mmetsp:Transcript_41363/g.60502  ORF Transcript_41363/g.60502 Transcript_41363/m.60502 type:complete len:715 (+) Transcript_41363:1-2145(+)
MKSSHSSSRHSSSSKSKSSTSGSSSKTSSSAPSITQEEKKKILLLQQQKEEEEMRIQKEEEELRLLAAQYGDADEKEGINDDEIDNRFTDFETEEEREERLAREQREKRRKRRLAAAAAPTKIDSIMDGGDEKQKQENDDFESGETKRFKKIHDANNNNGMDADVDTEMISKNDSDIQDNPRNTLGIIASEKGDEHYSLNQVENKEGNNSINDDENDDDDDDFDMFSDSALDASQPPSSKTTKKTTAVAKKNGGENDAGNYDDDQGYYRANIGEMISLPFSSHTSSSLYRQQPQTDDFVNFKVLGIIGNGVFSTVLKCVLIPTISSMNYKELDANKVVAMKVIRSNETMAKAAIKEARILRLLRSSFKKKEGKGNDTSSSNGGNASINNKGNNDNVTKEENDIEEEEHKRRIERNHNIVRLLDIEQEKSSSSYHQHSSSSQNQLLEYRSHAILLFEHLPFNLRETLSKFGKNVGINLTAVKSYARQLFCALNHLAKHRVVHADIKPDNILVSADFSTVKLCDFGSAFFETDTDNDPTPYLVSRFYRPPEVILGLEYDRAVDMWSVSVTLAELFTGSVLFPGHTNNDMIRRFMESMGSFSNKMVRRHSASYGRMGLVPHFEAVPGGSYNFRRVEVDRVTERRVVRVVTTSGMPLPARRMARVLLVARSGNDGGRGEVLKFADLLDRCLALDPGRRASVREALGHDFFASGSTNKN